MTATQPNYLPRRINQYVPAMGYASDVVHGGPARFSLGTPAVADADGLLDGVATTTQGTVLTLAGNANLGAIGLEADATYGRNVTFTGAGSGSITMLIRGRDYLGQPMAELVTGSTGAGASAKAFKWIDTITTGAANGDSDSDFGWGDVLGLPYRTVRIIGEEADEVNVATLGTFVSAVNTDPQTSTTGDPRGTYNPTTTLNGSVEIHVTCLLNPDVNSSGNGGLHGIQQYYA